MTDIVEKLRTIRAKRSSVCVPVFARPHRMSVEDDFQARAVTYEDHRAITADRLPAMACHRERMSICPVFVFPYSATLYISARSHKSQFPPVNTAQTFSSGLTFMEPANKAPIPIDAAGSAINFASLARVRIPAMICSSSTRTISSTYFSIIGYGFRPGTLILKPSAMVPFNGNDVRSLFIRL
jgi:hypothetical protein